MMKGAPNWTKAGDSVDGVFKQQLLTWLGKTCNLRILVETGTCHGSTPAAVFQDFDDIYTMELHDGLYEGARKRLQHLDNVHVYHGSSKDLLRKLLAVIPPGPLLFWLDAHSSGPHTADDGDPLPGEIATITELRPDSLVVIDDMQDAELRHVSERGVSLDDWIREYRTGEIIMHRGGYVIPPFEE